MIQKTKTMKKTMLFLLIVLFHTSLSAQITFDPVLQIANQNDVELLTIENSILQKQKEIDDLMKGIQEYQQTYADRTLACELSSTDYAIFQNNKAILLNIKNNLMPNLIAESKTYLETYWGLSTADIQELNDEYAMNTFLTLPKRVYFNGQTAPQSCNLQQIATPAQGPYANMSPLYLATEENLYPLRLGPLPNESLTIAASAAIEMRVNKPTTLEYQTEFPELQPYFHPELTNPNDPSFEIQGDITWGQVGLCALQATGLDILVDLQAAVAGNGGILTRSLAKSVFKKAIKKVASYATGAGVGIAVVAFGWCLATS